VKIQNAFRLGIFGGLGVLIALLIGGAFASLATILTYIGAAIFIALGLDPLISWLESRKWPRWAAILTVLVGVLGLFAGLVFAIIPVVIEQSTKLINQISSSTRSPSTSPTRRRSTSCSRRSRASSPSRCSMSGWPPRRSSPT